MNLIFNHSQNMIEIHINSNELSLYQFRPASLMFDSHIIERDKHDADLLLFVDSECIAYKMDFCKTVFIRNDVNSDLRFVICELLTGDENRSIERFERIGRNEKK